MIYLLLFMMYYYYVYRFYLIMSAILFYYVILFVILCSVSVIFVFRVMIILCIAFHSFYVIQFMYLHLYSVRNPIHRTCIIHRVSGISHYDQKGPSHFI